MAPDNSLHALSLFNSSMFLWKKQHLFPIESKLSTRRSYPTSQKAKQTKPENSALRWHGHTGANCLVHTNE